ncbi:DUF402 domain-containing protein [Deinococcus sp.]|uniref:DUF402 domain-containing protein n=1 Tax=Deinococcus sp. TaxID=47478 RepID=UPI003C79A8A4
MKRKTFDLSGWARAESHTQTVSQMGGHIIVDFRAGRVSRPYDVHAFGETQRVLDSGYRWLRIHPHGAGEGVMGHALTVQLDGVGAPVQLYIDIHGGEGVTKSGFPWHDDLYLDVLGRIDPESWVVAGTELIDQDELQEALDAGRVSTEQFRASHAEAERVRAALMAGTFGPVLVARVYLGLSRS